MMAPDGPATGRGEHNDYYRMENIGFMFRGK
jgi:hypothetical protein